MRLDSGQIEVMDDIMAEVLRMKTPSERIRIGFDIWTSVQKMLTSHLKSMHPDWNNESVDKEVVRRLSHGAV